MRQLTSHAVVAALCAAGLLASGYVAVASAASPAPEKKAVTPKPSEEQPLSDLARQVLHKRMQRHGQDMSELNLATILLRYDRAGEAASRIASEPRLVRPTMGDAEELNASIPERFYVLQDQLRDKALRLAAAAKARDTKKLAEAYGELSTTCITCHASFLPEQK